jgi:hypothetical protein
MPFRNVTKSIAPEGAPTESWKNIATGGSPFSGRLKALLQQGGDAGTVIEARDSHSDLCRRVFRPDAFSHRDEEHRA